MKWFSRKKSDLPAAPVSYPAGVVVSAPSGRFFINKDGKKYRITSNEVFRSWNFPLVIETSDIAISEHPTAVTRLGFRDGSLLNNIADGKLYLVSEGKLRHITGLSTLETLGVTKHDAMVVSASDIHFMKKGQSLP